MFGCSQLFPLYTPCSGSQEVRIVHGSLSSIVRKGFIHISKAPVLNSVLHMPNLSCNPFSISKFTKDNNCVTKFFPTHCDFQDLAPGMKIGSAKEVDRLYYFTDNVILERQAQVVNKVSSRTIKNEIMLWYYRSGHPSFYYLQKFFPSLFKEKKPSLFQYEVCKLTKHDRSRFPIKPYQKSTPFVLIHSDVWGPSRVTNIFGTKWFVSFIDDHTHLCWLYLLKEKFEVEKSLKDFCGMVQIQFQAKIKGLKIDKGKKYFSKILGEYRLQNGIIHQSTCFDMPQQNGIGERKKKTFIESCTSNYVYH